MDHFRQIGEVIGGLQALMVLKHEILLNQKQCCLLFDIYTLSFQTISEGIRQNLKLEEKNTKWKALDFPLKELHRVLKEGEHYIKTCLDVKNWWGKAITFYKNRDCVEFHIHNLLCCFTVVIEAIEAASEISGFDQDDMQKKRVMIMKKYENNEGNDPKIFQWLYGKQYLVSSEICSRLECSSREDKWVLLESAKERRKNAASLGYGKNGLKLGELLIRRLNGSEPSNSRFWPSWVLLGADDYYVKRRLGSGGSRCKEIHWLGENFALRTFFGEIEPLNDEFSLVLDLSHPNIMQYLCGFYDEERKEGFLVMELMTKNLFNYIKENSGQKKRVPFTIPASVDIMLQIARGMEYLHSQKIFHGDLNPSNVLLKPRNGSTEGYFHAKVTGFGLISIKCFTSRTIPNQNETDPVIWYAPEVLAEKEQMGGKNSCKYTEKADVYSFGMLCFQLLTGKIPFEEEHLQGDKMVRNIRAGERPLFPHPSPKYLANLTRRCWQTKPDHRPNFSSICRILRYIKKVLVINPDHGQPESPPPLVDYCDIELGYTNKFMINGDDVLHLLTPVLQIPFQMFAYRLIEKDKSYASFKDKNPASIYGDDHEAVMDDLFLAGSDRRSVCSEVIERKNFLTTVADQRSVVSEIPQRNRFLADQRSVLSESPGRNFLTMAANYQRSISSAVMQADQRSNCSESVEKKTIPKSVCSETSEKKVMLNATDHNGSETPERNFHSTKTEIKSLCSDNQEKQLHPTVTNDKICSPQTPERTFSFKSTEDKKTAFPVIPEEKVLPTKPENPKPVHSENQGKKTVSTTTTGQRSVRTKIPETKKSREPKTHKETGIPKKRIPAASASSTPTRRLYSSTRSLPTRTPKVFSSPRSSPARTHEEYSSPISSPMNPCARCSRMKKDELLTTHRNKKCHVSDTEAA